MSFHLENSYQIDNSSQLDYPSNLDIALIYDIDEIDYLNISITKPSFLDSVITEKIVNDDYVYLDLPFNQCDDVDEEILFNQINEEFVDLQSEKINDYEAINLQLSYFDNLSINDIIEISFIENDDESTSYDFDELFLI